MRVPKTLCAVYAVTLGLTLAGYAPASATDAPGEGPSGVTRQVASVPDLHLDRHAGDGQPPTLQEMYRQAGLTPPSRTDADTGSDMDGTVAAYAEQVPPGTSKLPGMTKHVASSCTGTGADGNRVQVLYARTSTQPSMLADYLPIIRNEVAMVDDVYAAS